APGHGGHEISTGADCTQVCFLEPTVTGSLRGAELDGVNGDAVSLGLDLSWEADVWGRIRSAETASILDAVAENAAFEGTRLSLAGAVAEAWFTVNGNAELVFVNASEVRTQRSALNFVVQQVEAGQALSVDANIARANVATSEARLADSQSDLQNSIRALEVLLGRYPSAQLRPRGGVGGLPGRVPVGLPAQLLERRPDVIEAERRLAAAYYRTESARAARLPTISINADASSGGSSLSDVLDGSNVVSSLIAGIAGPIFDGQGRATDERIANARQTQALELYAATALTAFREVEDALSSEQALARQAGALSRAVNQLRQALDVEQQRYEAGEIGIDRVDDARLRFFNARRDLVNVRVAQLRQRVQLHLALGGSFEDAPATETVVAAAAEG
ncbi:MAG: TolC family protein, partial [Pseudomonadota bacterium]